MIRGIDKEEEVISDNLRIFKPGKNKKCGICIEDSVVPDNQYAGW